MDVKEKISSRFSENIVNNSICNNPETINKYSEALCPFRAESFLAQDGALRQDIGKTNLI